MEDRTKKEQTKKKQTKKKQTKKKKNFFESKKVMCPYYLRQRQQEICCESTIPKAVIHMTFPHINLQREHQSKYCYTMEYEKCPHCKALMKKYAEEDK